MAEGQNRRTCSWELSAPAAEVTRQLGRQLGKHAPASTILALSGNLGAGKTTLVQGVARGLDVPETYYITSPTFTLINEYPGRLVLYHVDLYRIGDPDELVEIGLDEILHGDGLVAIEWPEQMGNLLPVHHLAIDLIPTKADARRIGLTAVGAAPCQLIEYVRNNWKGTR